MDRDKYFITAPEAAYSPGGKGGNLFTLRSLGFNVPEFVVIPVEILRGLSEYKYTELSDHLISYFEKITGINKAELTFAVRSSALAEDHKQASFAGMFESMLGVNSGELVSAIKKVKASANTPRVLEYADKMGISREGLDLAIIVQILVNADISGVGFGIDPVSGNTSSKTIAALYGLGEGLVSGALDADTYILKNDGNINVEIAHKTHQFIATPEGTIKQPLEPQNSERQVLTTGQIREVGAILDKLEKHFHTPQDIEFGYAGDQFYLFQSRAVTTLKNTPKGERLIWDNSNIIESYPGLTLPLTFSFIIKMYEAVYSQLMGVMGVSATEVAQQKPVLSNMLGMYHGRVYYNLLHWYKALATVPGFALNAPFMEKMMGVSEKLEFNDLPQRSKIVEWLRVMRMIVKMLYSLISLPAQRRKFSAEFSEIRKYYEELDLKKMSLHDLMHAYNTYETTLLKKWKAPLVNDFFVMIYFGILQKTLNKYGFEGHLHNDLLAGSRDIVSTEPAQLTIALSELIRNHPDTLTLFNTHTAEEINVLYQQGKITAEISQKITNYLTKWGQRISGELKLETETYRQNPAIFFKLLKSYIRQEIKSNDQQLDLKWRDDAEETIAEKLSRAPLKKALLNFLIQKTRTLVSARENLRYARTLAYGVVRNIFAEIGIKLASAGMIDTIHDVFYLTQDEVFSYIRGTSVNRTLKEIVEQRKINYEAWNKEPAPPERFETYGIPYENDPVISTVTENITVSEGNALKGLGCCPGIVKAPARILLNPMEADDLQGAILVTVHTDPGWVTLFPTAGGIIVEKGSLLSHSAIVSREMGIPCIVGVKNATSLIRDNAEIEMNGRTGEIKILEQ